MQKPEIRRENLRRFVRTRLGDSKAKLTELLGNESPGYVNDLLREGSGKSFGEKAAATIEQKIGLKAGQLDLEDSPLLMDESRLDRAEKDIEDQFSGLTRDEKLQLSDAMRQIYAKRKKSRRA